MAKVIFGLSHQPDDGDGRGPKYINYRDLSVQQLGSIYERILEFGLAQRVRRVVSSLIRTMKPDTSPAVITRPTPWFR